jgi:sRNA-binding carbon storage regulator CsrA
MLVLRLNDQEYLKIGEDVFISAEKDGNCVKIKIEAPRGVNVARGKLLDRRNEAA